MTNYNDGKWHVWAKNEKPPLHDLTRIKRVFINAHGEVMNDEINYDGDHSVGSCCWHGKGGTVLAFRVTKEHSEPREFWVRFNHNGDLRPCSIDYEDAFMVREVLE